jgi:ribosome-binding ATPase YchF (GTP1/OBG family)
LECGSEKAIKDKGRFRLEGKDYIVKDGDILSIRFNV